MLDFTRVAAGPAATKLLALFGAQVVKIESALALDTNRHIGPFPPGQAGNIEASGAFLRFSHDKLDISINMKDKRGVDLVKALVAQTDVLIENFSPGTMDRWGLGYEQLKQLKPDLIVVSISFMGLSGPFSQLRGAGDAAQAISGLTATTGWPGQPPCGAPGNYADYYATPIVVAAIVAALDHRLSAGQGLHIDVSLCEAPAYSLSPVWLAWAANGYWPYPRGNRHPFSAPHGVYRCRGSDRWCAIAVFSDGQWDGFCRVLGDPPWMTRFATFRERWARASELDSLVEGWTNEHDAEEVMMLMRQHGVPAGVVQDASQVLKDPQLWHRDHFVELEHFVVGHHLFEASGFRLSLTPASLIRPPARLGQDNEEVFVDMMGLPEQAFKDMERQGVFR